jgi:membrane associated rhomboid family serine protease
MIAPIDDSPTETARAADARAFRAALTATALFVALLWWIKLIETWLDTSFAAFGVFPRELAGLVGVLAAPLIHGSPAHLLANTLPLLFLGTLALWVYPKASRRALPLIWLLSGLGIWVIGRRSLHFGASGIDHGLMFFVFALGILRREKRAIAAALATFLLYGGMLLTVLPREPEVSWEAHLCGALAGLIAAWLWRGLDPAPPRKKYSYELEEELEALRAERERSELELPGPGEVPVLWHRSEPEPEPRGQVIAFRRPPPNAPVPDPESPTRH